MKQNGKSISISPTELFERLKVALKVCEKMRGIGLHKSNRQGGSMEFFDRVAYTPGEDIRHLDWHVFARHDELFIEKFEAEEHSHFSIVVDNSASISIGSPPKLITSLFLACMFSYILLKQGEYVSIFTLNNNLRSIVKPTCGNRTIHDIIRKLSEISCQNKTRYDMLKEVLRIRNSRRANLIFISDLLGDSEMIHVITDLKKKSGNLNIAQILADEDLNPQWKGPATLIDSETGESIEIELTGSRINAYIDVFRQELGEIERSFRSNQIPYVLINNRDSDTIIINKLINSKILSIGR